MKALSESLCWQVLAVAPLWNIQLFTVLYRHFIRRSVFQVQDGVDMVQAFFWGAKSYLLVRFALTFVVDGPGDHQTTAFRAMHCSGTCSTRGQFKKVPCETLSGMSVCNSLDV